MSDSDNADGLDPFLNRDHMLPSVTAEGVKDALAGFPVPFQKGRDWDWLALAVRRALAFAIPHSSESPDRPPDVHTRDELGKLAVQLAQMECDILGRSHAADDMLWNHAFRHWEGMNALAADRDPNFGYNRFQAAVGHIEWLKNYFLHAAKAVRVQRPRWREAEWRELRIRRGQVLLPIFEAAFETSQANHFALFYQSMVWLAFPEAEPDIPDLEAIVSEMRRRHAHEPYVFSPKYITLLETS